MCLKVVSSRPNYFILVRASIYSLDKKFTMQVHGPDSCERYKIRHSPYPQGPLTVVVETTDIYILMGFRVLMC